MFFEMIVRGRCINNHKYEGQWVYGNCVVADKKHGITYIGAIKFYQQGMWDITLYEADCQTIGRYMSIKDKDGNQIFEGDIIEIHFDTSVTKPLVVKYGVYSDIDDYWGNNYRVGFYLDDGKSQQNLLSCQIAEMPFNDPNFLLHKRNDRLKVIGNIYDDPDLAY